MSFETGMVTALQTVTGIKIYPNYTQEGTATPYLTYTKSSTEYERVLENVNSALDDISFQIDLIHDTKALCDSFAELIEAKLLSMWNTTVGGEHIQDIEITNRFSQYEPEINKHREIIEIKVSY